MQPNQPQGAEQNQPVVSSETGALEHAPAPSAAETHTPAPEPSAQPAGMPIASVQPAPGVTQAPQAQSTAPVTGLMASSDEELIDKQWVSRTDGAIERDKNDPHKLEEDEDSLNKDYLKKRFNYDVDNPT